MAISDIRGWDKNPRKNADAVPGVARSIKRWGFAAPLVGRRCEDGKIEIIAGHTRLKAAATRKLHWVPVRVMELDAEAAHKLAIADNKLAEKAAWDKVLLGEHLTEWRDDGDDLKDLGFSAEEAERLMGESYESFVEEVDVSDAKPQFWLEVTGPLPTQIDALDVLKRELEKLDLSVVCVVQ